MPAQDPTRGMLSAGIDITPDWRSNVAAKREKKGECPTCGTQTHKIGVFGKKTPLTVDGRVRQGHCLKCHPIEGYMRRFPDSNNNSHSNYARPPVPQQQPPPYRGGMLAPPSQQSTQYQIHRTTPPMERAPPSAASGLPRDQRPSLPPQFRQPMQTQQLIYEHQQQQLQQQQLQLLQQQYHAEPRSGIRVPRTLEVGGLADDDVSVLTMDYRLTMEARHWNGNIDDHDEEGDGIIPPVPSQRPGPDSGEGYGSRRELYATGAPPRSSLYRHNEHSLSTTYEHAAWTGMGMGMGMGLDSQEEVHQPKPSHDSGSGTAWDVPAGLMPPGGMDDLFRNRVGENASRQVESSMNHDSFSEIRYEPRRTQPSEHGAVDDTPRDLQHHPYSPDGRNPNRLSTTSGPMYVPEDDPMYAIEDEEPTYGVNEDGPMYMNDDTPPLPPMTNHYFEPHGRQDTLTPLPAGLRTSKAARGAALTTTTTSGLNGRGFSGFSGPSQDTGSQSGSTMGPPLVNPDQRGRPDEAYIHDPADLAASIQYDDPVPPSMLMREEDRLAGVPNSPVTGGHLFVKKAPPRHDPYTSPIGSMKAQTVKPMLPTGLPLTNDNDGETSLEVKHVPAGLKAPPQVSNLKPPSGSDHDPVRINNGEALECAVPSPRRLSSTLRSLSIAEAKKSGVHVGKANGLTLEDIPVLMHCLEVNHATIQMKAKALRSLAKILWAVGPPARDFVAKSKGLETLIKTVWGDIGSIDLQDAAAEFLSSLVASLDGRPHNDLLSNEENVCDALLFAMQTHSHVASIQLKGCTIFSCLAAASSNNPMISDGSLSGSLMIVLAAMSNHPKSSEIQKAGLQALYYQCALSRDAESNKRSLLASHLENGVTGLSVISNCMRSHLQEDLVAMEWACRLCWLLTSSEDMVNGMSGTSAMIEDVIHTCKLYNPDELSGPLLEACFGVIGNMAHVERNRAALVSSGAIGTLLEGMQYQSNDLSVHLEACSAFANIARTTQLADAVLAEGGLDILLGVLQVFDQTELIGEALRALACLSIYSQEGKEAMTVPQVLKLIFATGLQYRESNSLQESCCKILASLSVNAGACDLLMHHSGLDFILEILDSYTDENVLDAACSVYRNLSCHVESADRLLPKGALRSLVECMSSHSNCVSLQTNICSSIWNLVGKTNRRHSELFDQAVVEAVVSAMQNNLESSELLEAACGALWSIIDRNIDRKRDLIACGAIDAVYCTMVMHEKTPTLMEACGVFSNISAEAPLAAAIASAQGVSAVSEAIRNNSSSIEFLEIGCLTLRNIVCQYPEYAQEASMAISPIINAMRENIEATGFQMEATNLLWVLATEAESCHTKILALDGPTVLMQAMDRNGHNPRCHEAAVGAFTHLVMSSNQ